MLLAHERSYYGLDMDAVVTICRGNTRVVMVEARILLEHARCYSLGMDALVTVCSWNTNVPMIWAWMLCSTLLAMLVAFMGTAASQF